MSTTQENPGKDVGATTSPAINMPSPQRPLNNQKYVLLRRKCNGGQQRLTQMPDYMKPIVKSSMHRWQKLQEDHMMTKLIEKRVQKKQLNQITREDARNIAKKIPFEILAKQWLIDHNATVETRAFLVEKVLPTLIIGCEKLLIEVDRRDLADDNNTRSSFNPFNPINFLAQYLMRNNPRYSNFSEASPYIRGLRQVSEELKKKLFDSEDNKLARIKCDAQKRREDREAAERKRVMEHKRREDLLRKQFNEWNIGYIPNGRVELALLQNALRLFSEIADMLPEELRAQSSFSQDIGSTDETGKTLPQKEFVVMIQLYVEKMPPEVFNQFLTHMDRCATAYRAQHECEQRRITLSQLFKSCDNSSTGLLDRPRILNLFEMFFNKSKDAIQQTLRDPRQWPLVDISVIESREGMLSELDKIGGSGQQSDMTVNVKTPVSEMGTEGKLSIDVTFDGEDPELLELVDITPITGPTENPSLLDQVPMTQQSKVSFAEGTTFKKESYSRMSRTQSQASAYDENTLNVSQFVLLIEMFLGDVPNMEAFHQLVRFIKTGYMETEEEKMQRLLKDVTGYDTASAGPSSTSLNTVSSLEGTSGVSSEVLKGCKNALMKDSPPFSLHPVDDSLDFLSHSSLLSERVEGNEDNL